MKEEQDYIKDIAAMRSMMERTSKFMSLSGLAGVMAGIYALGGAYIAFRFLDFNPRTPGDSSPSAVNFPSGITTSVMLAVLVLILAIGTAIFLSYKKAKKQHEKLWNATARRLLQSMAVPLVAGGLLVLILLSKGMIGFIAPFTLIFYGLALYNASKFTYEEVRSLGLIEIVLGLVSTYFVEYGLLCWAVGFGVFHIVYGIYMHYRYER